VSTWDAILVYSGSAAGGAPAPPSVVATPTGAASALALDGRGGSSRHVVHVATLLVDTTAPAGLSLWVGSGSLTKAGGTAIPYRVLTASGGSGAPGAGAFTTPSGSPLLFATQAAGPATRELFIEYTPAPLQDPGAYGATIELTVMDNS
jgi:hypothetical protein